MTQTTAVRSPVAAWRVDPDPTCIVSVCAVHKRLAIVEQAGVSLSRTDVRDDGSKHTLRFEVKHALSQQVQIAPLGGGALVVCSNQVWIYQDGSTFQIDVPTVEDVAVAHQSDLSVLLSLKHQGRRGYSRIHVSQSGKISKRSWGFVPVTGYFEFGDVKVELAESPDEWAPWWTIKVSDAAGKVLIRKRAPLQPQGLLWFDGWLVVAAGWVWGVPISESARQNGSLWFPFLAADKHVRGLRARVKERFGEQLDGWRLVPFSRLSARNESDSHHRYRWSTLGSNDSGLWDFGPKNSEREWLVLDPQEAMEVLR